MGNIQTFFSNFMNAVGCSKLTQENTLWVINNLIENDPKNLTKFEISFKIKNGKISKEFRFLNFDASAYSSFNTSGFLKRLKLFRQIMEGKTRNTQKEKVFKSLEEVSATPVDLYFGADIKDDKYLFAFWLIFGGVQKDGRVEFRPYNTDEIIRKILKKIGGRVPKLRIQQAHHKRSDMLNFGFDLDKQNLFFKIYWLHNFSKNGMLADEAFSSKIKRIRKSLANWRYFTFISEKYNLEGRCQYKKLFTEFLDPINAQYENLEDFLKTILDLAGSEFDIGRLLEIIKSINGRIALVSFEVDDTLTFYMRPK